MSSENKTYQPGDTVYYLGRLALGADSESELKNIQHKL